MNRDTVTIIQRIQESYTNILPDALTNTPTITVTDTQTTTTTKLLSDTVRYPFDSQDRTYYKIERETDPLFGPPQTTTNIIETREQSGLAFIISAKQNISEQDIHTELQLQDTDMTTSDLSLSPTFTSICDFIRTGTTITALELPHETSRDDPEAMISNGENIAIEAARITLPSQYSDDKNTVTYRDGEFDIPCETTGDSVFEYLTQNRTHREYITQHIETTFHDSTTQ